MPAFSVLDLAPIVQRGDAAFRNSLDFAATPSASAAGPAGAIIGSRIRAVAE
jgi:hypothetical protein